MKRHECETFEEFKKKVNELKMTRDALIRQLYHRIKSDKMHENETLKEEGKQICTH